MSQPTDAPIPLESLSQGQRDLIQRHLPLVSLVIRRRSGLLRDGRVGREMNELFQEGALALAESIRNHDPARHGQFAAYTMARIHFAISRYAHEQSAVIRVPFITQRRESSGRRAMRSIHRAEDPLPRIRRFGGRMPDLQDRAPDETPERVEVAGARDLPTVGDLIRDRIDAAGRQAIAEMKGSLRTRRNAAEIIDGCLAERWSIPDPDSRTSIRRLCEQYQCSLGRITHSEERFRKLVIAFLNGDPEYGRLRAIAKAHPAGLRHRPREEHRGGSADGRLRKLDPRKRGGADDSEVGRARELR